MKRIPNLKGYEVLSVYDSHDMKVHMAKFGEGYLGIGVNVEKSRVISLEELRRMYSGGDGKDAKFRELERVIQEAEAKLDARRERSSNEATLRLLSLPDETLSLPEKLAILREYGSSNEATLRLLSLPDETVSILERLAILREYGGEIR